MKVYEDHSSTYSDAIDYYWNLDKYSIEDGENAAFIGWAYMDNPTRHMSTIAQYKNRVYFNTEHPCVFQSTDADSIALSMDSHKVFNKVFTQCPYTAEWLNYREKSDRFKKIYIPFNTDHIVEQKEEKVYDALYWGGLHNIDHKNIIDAIKDHQYNFLTVGPETWSLWWSKDRWLGYDGDWGPNAKWCMPQEYVGCITQVNLHRPMMWELLRKTKVNVMTNLLYTDQNINSNIRLHQDWEKNRAFSHLEEFIMPQLKTRPIETAVNKCLMVVKKDPWNIQEMYFEPEKEFIYYEDKKDLQSILEDVKINWKNYEQIVENAFNKAINNYTTKHFVDELKKGM
jgi:hypothetical protein